MNNKRSPFVFRGALTLLIIGLIIVIAGVVIALVGTGVGWLLNRFLPFTLFEGTVVALISLTIGWHVLASFLRTIFDFPEIWEEIDE